MPGLVANPLEMKIRRAQVGLKPLARPLCLELPATARQASWRLPGIAKCARPLLLSKAQLSLPLLQQATKGLPLAIEGGGSNAACWHTGGSFAACRGMKSRTGTYVLAGKGALYAPPRKQKASTKSSAEAEAAAMGGHSACAHTQAFSVALVQILRRL